MSAFAGIVALDLQEEPRSVSLALSVVVQSTDTALVVACTSVISASNVSSVVFECHRLTEEAQLYTYDFLEFVGDRESTH